MFSITIVMLTLDAILSSRTNVAILYITMVFSVADLEGFLGFRPKPPLRFQKPFEYLMEDALKLTFLEGSVTPLFHS